MDWDFFIAHAGADAAAAEALHELLKAGHKSFLDKRSIAPGLDWTEVLASAQRNSLVTVLLLSSNTKTAYYQREEIANAIHLSRQHARPHYVVPVFLDEGLEPPYGLRIRHSIQLAEAGGFPGVVDALHNLLIEIKRSALDPTKVVATPHLENEEIDPNFAALRTTPISGLVFANNDDVYEIWMATLNTLLHPSSTVTRLIPSKIDRESAILAILAERRHFIILPLTLPNYSSLRFAEHAHRLNSPTRIILSSSTNTPKNALEGLFDSYIPTREFSVRTIGTALVNEVARSLSFAEIERRIEIILGTAACFTVKAQYRHNPHRPSTLNDYHTGRLAG
jgi:hypothetical protein